MRSKQFGIILLAALAVLTSTVVLAQQGPMFFKKVHGRGGEGMAEVMAERLALNEEQRASLKTFVEQLHAEIEPLREQVRTLHEENRKELESGSPNATAIGEREIAAHAIRQKMRAAHDAFKERLGTILDEEQKEKLGEMHERMHFRRFEINGPGMHFEFEH
ncbi:MAG TPA: Spy/CpxP family protein refolding chaperone [Thermoanaerobaculia bacterium]|nr:Spy/CpxP family protein refolding chaperone [Thermoanaerobaculia bacterium]